MQRDGKGEPGGTGRLGHDQGLCSRNTSSLKVLVVRGKAGGELREGDRSITPSVVHRAMKLRDGCSPLPDPSGFS